MVAIPPTVAPEPPPAMPAPNWKGELTGLKQKDALIRIAELTGGIVRTLEVGGILVSAGIAKGKPKFLNSHMHTLLGVMSSAKLKWFWPTFREQFQPAKSKRCRRNGKEARPYI